LLNNLIKTKITFNIPSNPIGNFINIIGTLTTSGTSIKVDKFKIGKLTIPGVFINYIVRISDDYLLSFDIYNDLKINKNAIKHISINNSNLNIVYEWDIKSFNNLRESGKNLLLSQDQQTRLILYQNELATIIAPYKKKNVSLVTIIRPMFKFASQQTNISNSPKVENIAMLQVLSLYAINKGLKHFINADMQNRLKIPVKATLTLNGRHDLAQHFLVSAGLTISTGTKLANLIGLAKEVEDSDGGSGFSFADLAADKAGVKLAETATDSEYHAFLLQENMVLVKMESEFMPAIDRLPEGIMKLEFNKQYGDLDSSSYNLVNNEIEKRIQQCKVYMSIKY